MTLPKKKSRILLTALFLAFTVLYCNKTVFASIQNMSEYTLGSEVSGAIADSDDEKYYYQFTLPSSGKIHITGKAKMERIDTYLYDSSNDEVWSNTGYYWNSTSEVIVMDDTIYLTAGTYMYCVSKDWNATGEYSFQIDFASSNESFAETGYGVNNKMEAASSIQTDGTQYIGQLAQNDSKDFYKFHLDSSGCAQLNATFHKIKRVNWYLYNASGEEVTKQIWLYWNSTTENIVVDESLHLTSGDYYFCVEKEDNQGIYDFSVKFTSAGDSFSQGQNTSNNDIQHANEIALGQTYNGLIAINDEKNFYKFNISASGTYALKVDADMSRLAMFIYDANGQEQKSFDPIRCNDVTKKISTSFNVTFNPGTYYIAARRYDNYGNYSFSISGLNKSNCDHSYEDTTHAATYFAKGYSEHKCKYCGNVYKDNYTSVKKLGQCSVSTLSTKIFKKKIKLCWYVVADADGYQIRYATSKNMKKAKVVSKKGASKTITKLKSKKKYYIQIRAYKKSKTKTVYGKWSTKTKIKTR